jgi:hypothetical protein
VIDKCGRGEKQREKIKRAAAATTAAKKNLINYWNYYNSK